MKRIGIIGTGNLGSHLCSLFIRNNIKNITVSDINHNKAYMFAKKYNVYINSVRKNINQSDIIFLTVKPNNISSVCNSFKKYENKTIVSTAAGVSVSKLYELTKWNHNVVRCMPNIPISVGKGSIVWYSTDKVCYRSLQQLTYGPQSFWVDNEEMIDVATVISGCIPAYISVFYQHYLEAGIEIGMDPTLCKKLLLNGIVGSSKLLLTNDYKTIIESVASKGGATEEGLAMMEKMGFGKIINKSLVSSLKRIDNISKLMD